MLPRGRSVAFSADVDLAAVLQTSESWQYLVSYQSISHSERFSSDSQLPIWKIAYVIISILLCHNLMRRSNGEWKSRQNLIFLPLWQAINHVAEEKAFSDFGLTNAVILCIGFHITGHNLVFHICSLKNRYWLYKYCNEHFNPISTMV